MGKREDIQAQIDALSKELAAADDDDLSLLVELDGRKTELRGTHARKWLKKLGLDDDDDQAAAAGDGEEAGDGDGAGEAGAGADPKPKPENRFFRSGSKG